MNLIDLNPQWLTNNLFIFLCPHCKKTYLSCKNTTMDVSDQMILAEKHGLKPFGPDYEFIPCNKNTNWKIDRKDFNFINITPSIDASLSGHWHGFIRNGQII